MTCSYCGSELPEGAMFCGECGRAVRSTGATPRASAEPPVTESTAGPTAGSVPPELVEEPLVGDPLRESLSLAVEHATGPIEPIVMPLAEPVPGVPEPAALKPEPEPVAAEPEPEPVAAEPEPVEPEEPEPVADEPQPVAEPESEPLASPSLPELAPDLVVIDLIDDVERCAQCDALLSPDDIFCPECGFVRRRQAPVTRAHDTNVVDAFPWGAPLSGNPLAAPVARQPEVPSVAVTFPHPEPDLENTRIVERGGSGERFVLQFSTGESVSVSGTGLIGRNPVAEPGEYFDSLVTVVDPGKSVSKTHIEFGQDNGVFWISDRFSGNGTIVREPDSRPRRSDPGKRYRIPRGTRVDIGEQFFVVS